MLRFWKDRRTPPKRNSLDEIVIARQQKEQQSAQARRSKDAEARRHHQQAARQEANEKIQLLLTRLDELGAPGATIVQGHAAWKLYTQTSRFRGDDITEDVYLLSTGKLGKMHGANRAGGDIGSADIVVVLENVNRLMKQFGVS